MAILRKSDVRALETGALFERLEQLKSELHREAGLVKTGGRATNPGRIRELRRTISRILTVIHERKLGIKTDVKDKKARAQEKKPAEKKAEAPKQEAKSAETKKEAAKPAEQPKKPEQAVKTVSQKENEVKTVA